MADTSISNLTATSPATAAHRIPIAITPFGSGNNGYITPALILSYGTSPVAGTTGTFTGKIAAGATGGFALFSNTAGAGPAITAGTATTNVNALSVTQEWSQVATTFTGIFANFTNTASAGTTKPLDIQVGGISYLNMGVDGNLVINQQTGAVSGYPLSVKYAGTEVFNIGYNGIVTLTGGSSGINLPNNTTSFFGWSGTLAISRISNGVMALGTGLAGSFAGRLKLTSTIVAATTVAALNASPTVGEISVVNDALAVTVKGATLAAGGSAVSVVVWNGANWVGI